MVKIFLLLAAQTIHYPGDLPDDAHAWSVHDQNRPNPVKVVADAGVPPSDAIVLFDGTEESVRRNWRDENGGPTKWRAENGEFVCVPGSGYVFTKEQFGDCQLHVEWKVPVNESGEALGQGNSGVYLAGKYELQVLESNGTDPAHMTNPNYADGQAAAFCGQQPPLVNPARKAGVWQTYDIIFHPAVWRGGVRLHRASVTCFFNGVLVHDNWELDGPTEWAVRAKATELPYCGPLALQDHGYPVPYRNIWIRRIPSRWSEQTCGGVAMSEVEVAKQRVRNGAAVFAKVKDNVFDFANADLAMQAVAYDPDGGYKEKMYAICDGLAVKIARYSKEDLSDPDLRDDVLCIKRMCKLMSDRGYMQPESALARACESAAKLISGN